MVKLTATYFVILRHFLLILLRKLYLLHHVINSLSVFPFKLFILRKRYSKLSKIKWILFYACKLFQISLPILACASLRQACLYGLHKLATSLPVWPGQPCDKLACGLRNLATRFQIQACNKLACFGLRKLATSRLFWPAQACDKVPITSLLQSKLASLPQPCKQLKKKPAVLVWVYISVLLRNAKHF